MLRLKALTACLRLRFTVVLGSALFSVSCYSQGNGTSPPPNKFYFPVGLTVSSGGNVLYAVNSDFDLQWNGGTLQSYDLHLIRKDVVRAIANPADPCLPLTRPAVTTGACPNNPPVYSSDGNGREKLGQTCAPPIDSSFYVRDSAIIGAFATDLQLSVLPPGGASTQRLFAPVRGDASLTWADVATDNPLVAPPEPSPSCVPSSGPPRAPAPYAPFSLGCGPRADGRCDAGHHAGTNPNEPGNSRGVTMPGEPFGMAQSEDGAALVVTHQTDTKTSLFATGVGLGAGAASITPSLQFVLDGLPVGGNGIAAVPHDPDAFGCPSAGPCAAAPRPAFLQTSRNTAELDLLRYYDDDGSSLHRPFIVKERSFPLAVNSSGVDSRGIAMDPTPRIACKAQPGADPVQCARTPARVFIANRTPESLILGEIGEPSNLGDGTYDADQLALFGNVPLSVGPSRVYLAPIVDRDGNYALRVFIVCFDAEQLYVYDPDAGAVEAIIPTGLGPFAMAFDPFTLEDVALHHPVPGDPREPMLDLKVYRFAYLASFTDSFVQVIDLDNSRADKSTFETVVYTLGSPQTPLGQR